MNRQLPLALVLLVGTAGTMTGCGAGGDSKRVSTVPVTGTVSLDGKPIAGATVAFVSTDANRHSFMGATDAEGKYTLSEGASTGAQTGAYKVVIEYYTKPGGEPVEITPDTDLEMMKKQGEVKQALPPNYSDAEQTELTFTVPEAGTTSADFQLTSR